MSWDRDATPEHRLDQVGRPISIAATRSDRWTRADPIAPVSQADRRKKKQKDTVNLVPRVGVAAAVCPPLVRLRSCLDWIRSISEASSRSDRCKNKTKKTMSGYLA
jgi:hypothetical protein